MGLTPPQVMQRLQVRSLDGLNYREALDLLRRQLLDESGAAAPATPSATAPSAPARTAAPAATSVPAPAPAYFDEEDDYDITLSLPDDAGTSDDGYGDEMDGMSEAASGAAPDSADDLYDVDEIPDVADVAEPRAAPPVPSAAGLARARELLERFRATTPGGAATPDQLKAYTNVIASQLDATQAGTLVRGLWGVAPNRLGTDQLYTLIQWGKDDAFAEEAPAVLAALKAEAAGKAPHASAPSQEVPSPRTARPARSTRANGASGASGGDA